MPKCIEIYLDVRCLPTRDL